MGIPATVSAPSRATPDPKRRPRSLRSRHSGPRMRLRHCLLPDRHLHPRQKGSPPLGQAGRRKPRRAAVRGLASRRHPREHREGAVLPESQRAAVATLDPASHIMAAGESELLAAQVARRSLLVWSRIAARRRASTPERGHLGRVRRGLHRGPRPARVRAASGLPARELGYSFHSGVGTHCHWRLGSSRSRSTSQVSIEALSNQLP